ncbi:MAG: ParA family protein [Deltaproteobacteria bacterium]|uniref:ParA family protein n=1 Tax=Desulfobacula sp. TaxID=2593537 RepID=UPI00198B99CC|nr:ParA family protein [Candidatus Desulfobacula maris]MBL6996353.1 ParA family protein [Desulfobacula sp.]
MSNIITIAGQKGGTGKSITAVNLATSLALFGKKTLLIDCDPQACATQWCGIKDLDYKCDITWVLSGRAKVVDAIVKTRINGLDIMPAEFNLFQVALKLAKNSGNEKILRFFLKDVEDDFDYIIIDSPSSYSFLSVTAMTAADWLLVCMSAQHNSIEDFHSLLRMVKYIRMTHDVPLKIAGLLFNRSETKKQIESFMENQNLSDVKKLVFNTFIPHDVAIQNSKKLKIPVVLHDIKSPAAKAYLNAAEELNLFFKQRGVS